MAFHVTYEPTPNPQSMKFMTGATIAAGSAEFKSAAEAQARSPLARKLFGFPWTDGVYVGPDFVTVTKQDWVDWETLAEPLAGLIQEHFERGEPALAPERAAAPASSPTEDSDDVRLIKEILENEIRPAVGLDGGDVVFDRFEDGVVWLQMRGACSGCPSSAMTLKQGIEARLMNAIPSIRSVEQA